MTSAERASLIDKISKQVFVAKRLRQGVVLSHKVAEELLEELKRIHRQESINGDTVKNPD